MSIWLVAGLVLVVESMVLTWAWALCRAAAAERRLPAATLEDRFPAAALENCDIALMPTTAQNVRVHPTH